MSDEEIEQAIELIQTMLAARAGEPAKVIEGTAEPAALPAPHGQSSEAALEPVPLPKSKHKPNRLMLEADTAVGPRSACHARCDRQRASDLYDRARVSWRILASTQLVYAKTLPKCRLERAVNSILAHCKNVVCDKSC